MAFSARTSYAEKTGPDGWDVNVNAIGVRRVMVHKNHVPSVNSADSFLHTRLDAHSDGPFVLVIKYNGPGRSAVRVVVSKGVDVQGPKGVDSGED